MSLGNEGEPITIHWKNGYTDKILIRNLDQLGRGDGTRNFTETVLAHIKRFQQDGLSFPMEIYLDISNKPDQRNIDGFEARLEEGIKDLSDENYRIEREKVGKEYIKFNLVTRQAEKSISGNVRKNARSLDEPDSDSKGKYTSQREKKRPREDKSNSGPPTKKIALPNIAEESKDLTRKINYNGKSYDLKLVSDIGGYHQIYSPTGPIRLVNQRSNDKILVRIPRNNEAPLPEVGFKYGLRWRDEFDIKIPFVHNRNTLATDGFYIVDKIPNKFDPLNQRHIDQVKQVLKNMSVMGHGPDFRPDNVRFNDKDELVLIDFSENPDVEGAKEGDFPGLMKQFTNEFAAYGENTKSLYKELSAGMSRDFRAKMDNALPSYYR